MIQTRLELKRGPQIGERAAHWMSENVFAVGTIIDIRDVPFELGGTFRAAFIATAGWPSMAMVSVDEYRERRDGVWRACSHSHGYNAAGLCFDCSAAAGPALTDRPWPVDSAHHAPIGG